MILLHIILQYIQYMHMFVILSVIYSKIQE